MAPTANNVLGRIDNLELRVHSHEERLTEMDTLLRGDGTKSGIGPIAMAAHEGVRELKEDQQAVHKEVDHRLDALERNNIKMAAWVSGGACVGGCAYKLITFLLHV